MALAPRVVAGQADALWQNAAAPRAVAERIPVPRPSSTPWGWRWFGHVSERSPLWCQPLDIDSGEPACGECAYLPLPCDHVECGSSCSVSACVR
ncbi:unnamed protein product, partial [Amoebophrya sp. A120]|eukprot:GSA120T00024815001.1